MRTRIAIGAGALITLILAASMCVRWIPAGHVGLLGEGEALRVLPAGPGLRLPFGPAPAVYPLSLGPIRGQAPLRDSGGLSFEAGFGISGRLDTARLSEFHSQASRHGADTILRQAALHGIGRAALTLGPAEIASGALAAPAREAAAGLLAPLGVIEVSLDVAIDAPASLMALARALEPMGKAGLIMDSAARAIQGHPESWEALTALGIALESERRPREAETKYLDALALKPTAIEPMAELVGLYTAVGEHEKLERLLWAALQSDPSSIQHYNWLAGTFMKSGDLDRAAGIYEKALETSPGNTVILNNLGGVYLKQNRQEDALGVFRRAVDASPADRQSLYNLGVALCSRGDETEGLVHLLEADRIAPGRAPILAAIARAQRALGRIRQSEEYERRAREAESRGGGA